MGRLLRSRRLAVWTIAALVVYVALGTVLPGVTFDTPVFTGIAALLTTETAACAIERTRRASRGMRKGTVSRSVVDALRDRPAMKVALPDDGSAMDVVARSFEDLHLKSTCGDVLAEGRSGTAALLASPVFHWSLVLLFAVVALGQLTRAEGLMGVVVGSEKRDVVDSYGRLDTGPFQGELSGRIIAVTEIAPSFVGNDVEQGPTPYVELRNQDGEMLAEGYVHANSPLRYGTMLVHMNGFGFAAVVEVESSDSVVVEELLFDYDDSELPVIPPLELTVTGPSGEDVADLRVEVLPVQGGSERIAVTYAPAGAALDSSAASTVVLRPGDSVALPGDVLMTVERLTGYARLSVVDDWSVPVIYVLFATSLASLTVAVLVPTRLVRVLVLTNAEGCPMAHVSVRCSRTDIGFPSRVERTLTQYGEAGSSSERNRSSQ